MPHSSGNRRSRLAIAALAAFALFGVACGSDKKSESTTATTTAGTEAAATTTAASESTTAGTTAESTATTSGESTATTGGGGAAPTGPPVKIALVYSETGRTAGTYGTTDTVAKAWEKWVNTDQGGVNGHPVEVLLADGQSTGEGAAAAGRTVVDEGAVGVIIQDSTAESALADYLASAGVPVIGGTANNRPQDSGTAHWPNTYFVTAPSNPSTAASTMIATASAGLKKYGAAVCAEVPACADAGKLYSAVGPMVGVDFVGLVTVGAADPSYTAPCLELIGKGAEVINLGLASSTALSVIDECGAQGYTGGYSAANNSVTARDYENVDGLRLIGGINGFPWWSTAAPVKQYNDVVKEYGDGGDVRDPSSTGTWTALELFRKAMGQYGPKADAEIKAADVIAAYHQIKNETLDGLLPAPVTYVTEGFQPLLPCFWLFDMESGGKFKTITYKDSGNGQSGDLQTSCFKLG